MPVTAKLSLRLYEKLGEAVANELVEWFNSVDATYRSDLRELNELNFSRFDARLEQRVAELRAELRGSLRALEGGLSALEARMEARFEAFEGKLVGRFESRIAEVRTEMQRWMLASWASMMLVLLGTLFAVLRTR